MKKRTRFYSYLLYSITSILLILLYINHFNLTWVETNNQSAKVTINFLFPMEQQNFNNHVYICASDKSQNHFDYHITWLNEHIAEINVKELNEIKGQKIQLIIKNAPSTISGINKSENIPIQFKTQIQLIEPIEPMLISSTHSFLVKFNTPIAPKELQRSLKSEVAYHIKPYNSLESTYLFSPSKRLENGKQYQLTFLKGMKAKSKVTLHENRNIILQVDQKPSILKTYPVSGDKWIGLYPLIQIESKEEIVSAEALIDETPIQGTLMDERHAYFILDNLLKPETEYELSFRVKVPSGEVSDWTKIRFTTTSINNKRFWLDIHMHSKKIGCYEGDKCIRTLFYDTSLSMDTHLFGTYYLQFKSENYEDPTHHLGANYWFMISKKLGIQGTLRDDYWQPITNLTKTNNFVLNDEDAAWLFDKIRENAMVIVRK